MHYRIPEGKDAEALVLYVKNATGTWEERDYLVEGSFMIFEFTGEDSGFALAEKLVINTTVVIVAIAAIVVVGIGICKKKKGSKK